MIGRVLGDEHNARDAGDTVRMLLGGRIPEVLRIVLLAGEKARVRRLPILRERERERDLHNRTIRPLAFTLEVEHVEIADASRAERLRVSSALPLQHPHRKAFAFRYEIP